MVRLMKVLQILIRDILAATKTTAGVMTAADKTNLDNTVQGLANEITNRTNAINDLRTELKTYVDDLIADTGSDVTALETKVNNHIANKSNPHTVTKLRLDWVMLIILLMPISQYLLLKLLLLLMLRLQVLLLRLLSIAMLVEKIILT